MTPEKIAPSLLAVLADFQDNGRAGLAPHVRTLGLVTADPGPSAARIVTFIRCDDDATFDDLAPLGVVVNQRTGRVRTAFLPVSAVGAVSDHPAVARIAAAHYLQHRLDAASAHVHLPQFRAATGLTGHNVVVGVVDSGIDPAHAAFSGRIHRVWDQTVSGVGVAEGGYGVELHGAMLSQTSDTNGHGTHVAGIAAGKLPIYGGVAPAATLVIVKTDLQDAHIADGVRYIFRVAGELGRPAVVNLSLGGHFDAHDGSDDLSALIDQESGAGRIVCCAAGNEGNDNIHAQVEIPAGGTRTVRFRVPTGNVGVALLNGWYASGGSLTIAVRSPGGYSTTAQGVIATGNPTRVHNLPDARVVTVTGGPDPGNGDQQVLVQAQAPWPGASVAGGVWQLRLRNTGAAAVRVDLWALDDQPAPEVTFTGASVRDSLKIGSPGAAAAAVTVASFTTKNQWTDSGGNGQAVASALNTLSEFSSEGPLRTGARKPDVAAPGEMIVSARSVATTPAPAPARVIGPGLVALRGTSMASPFVAGLVALLLQRDPTLTPAKVKTLLQQHSRIPGQSVNTFDPKWGYGVIDTAAL